MTITRIAIILTLALGMAADVAMAQTPPAATESASTNNPGRVKWERRGAATGRPIVIVPSFGLSPKHWEKLVGLLESNHPVYLVTLPGAVGVPAGGPPYLDNAAASLSEMIRREKLEGAIVVGHWLSVPVVLRIAADESVPVAGVALMPLRVKPPPPDVRATLAAEYIQRTQAIQDDMWKPSVRMTIQTLTDDTALHDSLQDELAAADRAAYTACVGETLADLYEDILPRIRVPVLLIANVTLPMKSDHEEIQSMTVGQRAQMMTDRLKTLFPGLRKCQFSTIRDARMFMMHEQPGPLSRILDRFDKKLADPDFAWDSTPPQVPSTQPGPASQPRS